ncbi:MAG TPA: hypothetical protein VGR47_17380 [Terracidiphilus sp.]|nr:hypothetical protein [Terracidiphilus sp.]
MNRSSSFFIASLFALVFTVPAFAGITVTTPYNGQSVSDPFHLVAYATTCGSSSVVSMGYSFDSSSDTTTFNAQSIDTHISASSGTHTLHIKAWGTGGVSCVVDKTIDVTSSSSSSTTTSSTSSSSLSVPSSATSVSSIQVLSNWKAAHDTAASGSASGYTALATSPSLYGTTRTTVTSFTNSGAERYSTVFSDNNTAENFVYDAYVYLTSSSSKLANLEFDINQTMANGQTVLTGIQCDGWTGQWAYNANNGSASSPRLAWMKKSGTSCNPQKWSQYKWHHVQFSLSRNSSGYITYHSVWLDGVETPLNVTVYGGASLGWGPAINTQFQIDGYGSSGTVTAYIDSLKISMW